MMKKLLALILALSLCVSLTASLAESNAPLSGAFGRALQEWIQSLDPSSTDLRIDWTDGEKTSSADVPYTSILGPDYLQPELEPRREGDEI